nr:OmpA family protein [Flavihumibacter fluminis]
MVVIQAAAAGYKNNKLVETLDAKPLENLVIKLDPETQDNLAAELEEKGKLDLYGIYFDTDKAVLKPESEKTLQQVLAIIRQHPDWKLEIGGHTDAEGNAAYNLELSEKRANAVVDWLKKSAAASKLAAKGYGATQPVADNSTVTGRALNRRVEIKLLK